MATQTNYSDLGKRSVQARRLAAVERRIQQLVEAAPPLTAEQRARLAALLSPNDVGTAA